jgi:hypothetical protein
MKPSKPLDWDVLREDVARGEQNAVPWDDELRRARERFASTVQQTSRRSVSRRMPALVAAVALAASVALGIFGWHGYRSSASITFDTGSERTTGRVGALLSAVQSEPLPIHFSDGTIVSMSASTQARITETSSQGATIVLENGSLSLAVVHRQASSWHVAAGPFTVLVTGTKFDVRWSSAEGALALELHEGAVTVLGPTLGGGGRRVLPGESLRVAIAAAAGAAPPAVTTDDPAATPPTLDDAPKVAPSDSPSKRGDPLWKQLAENGRYQEALAAAESEGFEGVLGRASAADLRLLGDAARLAGSPKRAEQALQMARTRAAGTHEAAMAAFSLGRLAAGTNSRAAARWFQTYLREEPSGRLAREASGRLMEAQRASGDVAAARETASSYLAKYPAGPHAGLARTILNP